MPGQSDTNPKPMPTPRASRRREDAARFVLRFKELTGFDVTSDSAPALPREFLAQLVPSPDELLRRYGPELALRTRNALCRFEPGRPDEPWNFARLLETRGLGVFSLIDLLEVLIKHDVYRRGS